MNRILLLIAHVARTWTLPISMSIGAGVYLLFYYIPALEGLSQWFAPIFEAILPLFMFLILYVTFCKVDFKKLAPVPWHWWMIAVQCILVGSITGAILFFGIRGKELILLESVLACIISPCAAAAAVVTLKLGGNLEQMTAYPCVFSADRTSLADDLLGSFLADNAEGMFGAGRTDVIGTSY